MQNIKISKKKIRYRKIIIIKYLDNYIRNDVVPKLAQFYAANFFLLGNNTALRKQKKFHNKIIDNPSEVLCEPP